MGEVSSHVEHREYIKAKKSLKLAEHNLRRAYNLACAYESPLYGQILTSFRECQFNFTNEK
jgi:hypothetical protein